MDALRDLIRHRELLFMMTWRDIQVRYKQTLLGVVWAVAQPLAFIVILAGLKSLVFREATSEGAPHAIFLYCAVVPWIFFQGSLTFAVSSITGNMNLVKKVYFPREIFPVAVILACVVDFLIASALFVGMMLLYHVPFTPGLCWVPILFLVELVFVLGVGLFIAATNVFYRDIKYLVPLGIQLLFFACPVMYSIQQVPDRFRGWYLLNPIAVVIDGFRKAILHGIGPDPMQLAVSAGVAMLCFGLAYGYFKHVEPRFADLI